jgi:hypothetical protein
MAQGPGWGARPHEWAIAPVAKPDAAYVVATCGRCGLIRAQIVPSRTQERQIDLSGECPGVSPPAAPEETGPLVERG